MKKRALSTPFASLMQRARRAKKHAYETDSRAYYLEAIMLYDQIAANERRASRLRNARILTSTTAKLEDRMPPMEAFQPVDDVKEDWSPLHSAALVKRPDVAEELIELGVPVDATGERGTTPLHVAAVEGDKQIGQILIEAGADVNRENEAGATPLHHAVLFGHIDVTRVLIDAGADVNSRIHSGDTALHSTLRGKHVEIAELLIASGADVDAAGRDDDRPIWLALERDLWQVTRLLVDSGGDPNVRRFSRWNSGTTPLHWVASRDELETARVLLSAGADATAKDEQGKTPLQKAVEARHDAVARLLRAVNS